MPDSADTVPAPPLAERDSAFDRGPLTPRLWDHDGPGMYRRRIRIRTIDEHRATGELEDDFHHFRVDITHDGSVVTAIDGIGYRGPWTTCLDAGVPLQEVVGTTLTTSPSALAAIDARRNCTHMFDLAGLVVTHAARGASDKRRYDPGERRYDIAITVPDADALTVESVAEGGPIGQREPATAPASETRTARLFRDGELVHDWTLVDGEIAAPADWVGAPLRRKFIPWAGERFAGDDEGAEAAIVLRRALDISRGRSMDLDELPSAEPLLAVMEGVCHSMGSAIAPVAIRMKGSARDFTDQPELLLADFGARDT